MWGTFDCRKLFLKKTFPMQKTAPGQIKWQFFKVKFFQNYQKVATHLRPLLINDGTAGCKSIYFIHLERNTNVTKVAGREDQTCSIH